MKTTSEYEEIVLSYLREKHANLNLINFDLTAYVERCLDVENSGCPLEWGADCIGFWPETDDESPDFDDEPCSCTNCQNYHNQDSYCNRFKFEMVKFHEDIQKMLDIPD